MCHQYRSLGLPLPFVCCPLSFKVSARVISLSPLSLLCVSSPYIDVQCSIMQMLLTSLSIHGVSRLSPLCRTVSRVSSVSISRPTPPFRVLCPLVQGVCSCDLTLSLVVSFVCFFPLYGLLMYSVHVCIFIQSGPPLWSLLGRQSCQ